MKYPLGIIAFTLSIVLANWFPSSPKTDFPPSTNIASTIADPSAKTSAMLSSSVSCNINDSLILAEIYNNNGGAAMIWPFLYWWNPAFTPVCDWEGITMNSSGFVTKIELNAIDMFGTLPSNFGDGNLTQLETFHIANNDLSGTLPDSIGSISPLTSMWIDGNNFSGSLPESFGDLDNLETFFLDENQLTGKIPISFLNMSNLEYFEFFDNLIDSVPDLSSMTTIRPNRLVMQINRLTFDDILPNWGPALNDNYFPQDSVNAPYTVNLTTGSSYTLDLGFDNAITTSTYEWFRNGVPYDTTTENKLVFPSVSMADAGVYRCKVTNSIATQLTLHTRPVTINVTCGTSINDIRDSLCIGESINVNMTNYNQSNPTDTIDLTTPDGCDSVIYINLFYPEGDAIENFSDTICVGDTIFVNGDPYYQGNDFGFYFFEDSSAYGCDSILNVNIHFYPNSPPGIYPEMICPGDTLDYMGEQFYAGKETGLVTVTDKDINGCDSIVNVFLSFFTPAVETFDQTLCIDDSITINGTIYHALNPSGRDTIPNIFPPFCDSIIIVDLKFDNFSTGEYRDTLCAGDSITIDGVVYNEINPTGQDTMSGTNMCDSIVSIFLEFYPSAIDTFATTICLEDSVEVGGQFYSFNRPKDTLYTTTSNGCDSTLFIDLQFFPKVEVPYTQDLCPTDSVIINGTVYKVGKTSGTEVFENATANGCDSTVIVTINILPEAMETIDPTLCFGDSININGTFYHDGNRTGTERIPGAAPNGCDSVLTVNIDFHPRAEGSLVLEVCEGDCTDFNGTNYCFGDTGTERLGGAASNGCDSFVVVTVVELPEAESPYSEILCVGDSLLFNGTYYHDGMRTGTERVTGAAANGCDSVYLVSISFYDTVQVDFKRSLCFGESINIDGEEFNQTRPDGRVVLKDRSINGCDSIINVELDFQAFALTTIDDVLCYGDSITVNGVVYHENFRTGKDTIVGGTTSGCDSIICVDISFHPKAERTIDTTLCVGERLILNGVIYDDTNPSGRDTISGIAPGGCDSIFIIEVDYFLESSEALFIDICPGDSITINDTIYHAGRTTGTHIFENASIDGCDSTLSVFIDFHPIIETQLSPDICPGQTIMINSKPYDQDNRNGRDTFPHPITGCDSIVIITVSVSDTLRSTLDEKWCFDQSIEINTNTYDYFNRTGSETVSSSGGCDSIITIDLDFFEELIDTIEGTFCPDYSIEVNMTTYDFGRPTGTETMTSSTGCDSTVFVNLSFANAVRDTLDGIWCYEQTFEVDGETFDYFNRTGTKNFTTTSGCDSIVTIDLDFYEEAILRIDDLLCFEGTMEINSTIYDIDNPSDTIILTNANGCDSTIMINLSFRPEALLVINDQLCFGEEVEINGTTYDIDNPSDTLTLTNANGCDSTIRIHLDFFPEALLIVDDILCAEEEIQINGMTYGMDNPSDTLTLTNTNGCDSTIRIHLDFYPEAKTVLNERICEGEEFILDGEIFTEENIYTLTLKQNSSTGCDSIIELNLEVLEANDLGVANAGDDQLTCAVEAPLGAVLAAGTSGVWTNLNTATVLDPNNATSMAQNLQTGINLLVWTVSSPECTDYNSDTLSITLEALPEANDDDFTLNHLEEFADFDILENDLLPSEIDWFVELQNIPSNVLVEQMSDDLLRFSPNDFSGSLTFDYLVCSENCPNRCDSAIVAVFIEDTPLLIDTTVSIPNGITPNGDGLNDQFVIEALVNNPEEYPNNELIIFNRWGDIVYEAQPYLNDWDGKNKNGKELPQGTYYYVLRLSVEAGEIFKGDVTILK